MPDLDVFLQDQAAAEGAFSLCAIPARVNSLDPLMVDPDVAPQAGGGAEGALTQAAGELFHGLAVLLLHVSHIFVTLGEPGVTEATGPASRAPTPTLGAFAAQVPPRPFAWTRGLRGAGEFLLF